MRVHRQDSRAAAGFKCSGRIHVYLSGKHIITMDFLGRIDLQGQPLDLDITLACGQAFRWRKLDNGAWRGVVRDRLVEVKCADGVLLWRTFPAADEAVVIDYFRLTQDINSVCSELSARDPHLAELTSRYAGLRLVRQDPVETLMSFVCSAANSIPKISAAIEGLCAQYGDLVCEHQDLCYYAFPSISAIAEAESADLENTEALAFRGANLKMVARQVMERGENWLHGLREVSYAEAKAQLTSIRGVGSKIADCVCLFSLDMDEAVPVDTHVRQLAKRLFLPDMKAKSITDAVYRRIQETFWQRYGDLAGWAQQFLFYEDLLRSRQRRKR